ncbi:MAG: NUDIX hydrolase [Saprospiraceae bacterium]|nr:MAG: NUDIX hydrolase [Saprospiraceae bacterium]
MKQWTKLKEHLAYDGWRKIIVRRYELPHGQVADFDIVGNGPYVTIAAFTSEKEVILTRQFRAGPEQVLTSFSEGFIDQGESPEAAAARELLEETGYRAENIQWLKSRRSSYSTETQHFMLATNCHYVQPPEPDALEDIEVFLLSVEQFRALLHDSKDEAFINIAAGYLALEKLGWL